MKKVDYQILDVDKKISSLNSSAIDQLPKHFGIRRVGELPETYGNIGTSESLDGVKYEYAQRNDLTHKKRI